MISVRQTSSAAFLAVGLFIANSANASEYGCKVVLCLSNPNGPRAVSECNPPINQLERDLAKGRSFPTCEEAGSNTEVKHGYEPYIPCAESYPPKANAVGRNGRVTPDGVGYTVMGGDGKNMLCHTPVQFRISRDVYDYFYKPALRRAKPNWVEVFVDGKSVNKNWY